MIERAGERCINHLGAGYWDVCTSTQRFLKGQHWTDLSLVSRVSSKQSNFFSVRTKTNRNLICFGCFLVCFAKPKNILFSLFRFVSVFQAGIETTETNRIFSKQTETNQKKLQKMFSIRWSSKSLIFFLGSNRNKPKLNLFRLFLVCFFAKPKIFFSVCFNVLDRYRNNRNKQNFWSGELKRLIFLKNCCCFGWSFVCFGCFCSRSRRRAEKVDKRKVLEYTHGLFIT